MMLIGSCSITLSAPWVNSLKEKRMIVKSLIEKSQHKFNISIAEIEHQDNHKLIVLGFACVTNETRHANSMIDHVIHFIENHTEAEVIEVDREIL